MKKLIFYLTVTVFCFIAEVIVAVGYSYLLSLGSPEIHINLNPLKWEGAIIMLNVFIALSFSFCVICDIEGPYDLR